MKAKTQNKILFIMHYPPPVHGAAMVGQYIKNSTSINSRFTTNYINLSTSITVAEIGATGIVKWIRYIKILLKTLAAMITYRPNLVYVTITAKGIGFYKDALVVFIAKLFGKKVVLHFHNKGVFLRQDYKFDDFMYKHVFKNSKVILLAKELMYDVEKYVSLGQVYICGNGIPKIDFDISTVKKDKAVLLFLSNLIETKGVLVLLEACKILKERGVSFNCNVVGAAGDISVSQFKEEIVNLNLQNEVSYLGKKYGNEKTDVFRSSSIFVLPTFNPNECFPLVLLEAMQFSLPLISTSEGGIPSIVNEGVNGFMIQKNNANSLADILEKVIMNKELKASLGRNGKDDYESNFTLEKFEANLSQIFKTILNEV